MRKNLLSLGMIACLSYISQAQISQGGTPTSFYSNLDLKKTTLEIPSLNLDEIRSMDEIDSKNGEIHKIARSVETDISLKDGSWNQLDNGQKVWTITLHSENALGLGIYYDDFYLPPGAELFLYNKEKTQVLGAYTSFNNPESGLWANELIQGDEVTLELTLSKKSIGQPRIHINEVAYAYRDVHFLNEYRQFGDSDPCQVNVNCSPVGDAWQDEKRGVARILVKDGSSYGWCSGSLINNTNQDCTPYFLTADHCAGSNMSDVQQWIFYFNYEASACSNPSSEGSLANQSMTGGTFRANGGNDGDAGSDFFLLELNNAVPDSYNPYFNGWDRSGNTSSSGASIHHPSGDIKKISTYSTALQTTQWNGSGYNSHWYIVWSSNNNGHGVTEGGSSGSPLFDANGRIIGDLTGGSSYCSAQTSPDMYGKFSYSWESNGSGTTNQLKSWLDPANTGQTTLDGTNQPCGNQPPSADFTADQTTVVEGTTVNFTDLSNGNPSVNGWSWTFEGGTPSTSNSQNPSVTYNTAGSYYVTLIASNDNGDDTETKNGYITVLAPGSNVCDTIGNANLSSDNFVIYLDQNGGYLAGQNSYGDIGKMDKFTNDNPGQTEVGGALLYFGVAKGTGTTSVKVWDDNGGSPGTVLATESFTNNTIPSDGSPLEVTFGTPVTPDGDYYVGIEYSYANGDTVALFTNTDGETNPGTAWEKWSDNSYADYASGWGINVAHAIFVAKCLQLSTNTDNLIQAEELSVYPNPSNGLISTNLALTETAQVSINIVNVLGEVVATENMGNTLTVNKQFDLSNHAEGLYFVEFIINDHKEVRKVTLIK